MIVLLAAGFLAVSLWPGTRDPRAAAVLSASPRRIHVLRVSEPQRLDALHRAVVWREPHDRSPAALVQTPDPDGTFGRPVDCRYQAEQVHGTTPKFDCMLASGEVIKVKYGLTRERQAEVAASRLLTRLGFGADDMFVVPAVRCFGCPRRPFEVSWVADHIRLAPALLRRIAADRYVDFEWTAVERRFDAQPIESDRSQGWAFYELDGAADGNGASADSRDALRLAALLLAHWDNKADNQRLVCLDRPHSGPSCAHPFAFIQDLGATFGPNKVDLDSWRDAPIWSDPAQCTVSMRTLPYGGGTFRDRQISEGGRQRLLGELQAITQPDAEAMFAQALFESPGAWASVFVDKVRQIRDAGPCPSSSSQ